jgi:ABC-type multidrug transport system fused ATPase/permease subunit
MSEESPKRLSFKDLSASAEIFKFIKPYRAAFFWGILFLLLSSATALVFPYVTGKLVDAATGNAQGLLDNINSIALGLIGVLVLQSIFSYIRVYLFAIVSEKSMADIRNRLFDKIISMPVPFFEQRRVGELVSRITSDVTQLQETLSLTLAEFLRQIATLIVGISIIMITSTKLTLMMLATFPVLVITAIIFGRYIRRLSKKTQDALADANVVVDETFQAINVVKAFTNEMYESIRYKKAMGSVVDFALKAAQFRGAFISFIIFGLFGGIVLVLWYGSFLVSNGEMTIGELTAFIIYTTFIGGAVGGMGEVYSKIQKTIGASERLRDILNSDSEIELNNNPDATHQIVNILHVPICAC